MLSCRYCGRDIKPSQDICFRCGHWQGTRLGDWTLKSLALEGIKPPPGTAA